MALSMYAASVPVFTHALKSLREILRKGAAFAEAKKIDPTVLTGMRLAPDMLALSRQIHIATDNAKGPAARLAGVERPVYEDTETTFAELEARIDKTIAFLDSLRPEQFEGSEDRTISLQVRGKDIDFRGAAYLMHFALPNFYFHVTTAYAILRHAGVEIGKLDFLGSFPTT